MATDRKRWPLAEQLPSLYEEIGELAREVAQDDVTPPSADRRPRLLAPLTAIAAVLGGASRRLPRALGRPRLGRPAPRHLVSLGGVLLIVAGIWVVAAPLLAVRNRGNADDRALQQWRQGGSKALVGAAPNTGGTASGPACGSTSPSDTYALVSFGGSVAKYGYSAVAGDGDWNMLLQRSMVHYSGSAAPGQVGNDIIAFHREPDFQNIDQLKAGDVVSVQDRDCKVWNYRITRSWDLSPDRVTQLAQTSDAELTLITCTPWFQDYDRLVWRGVLIGAPNSSPATPAPTTASVPFPVQPLPTATPTPTPKPSPSPTPSPSATAKPTHSGTPRPTEHPPTPAPPTPSQTAALTPSQTPPGSPPPVASATPSPSTSPTPSPSPSPTPKPSDSPTPTPSS